VDNSFSVMTSLDNIAVYNSEKKRVKYDCGVRIMFCLRMV